MDLDLVNAREHVLDRVFDGDDLAVRAVNIVETAVKRGRLTRTCRASDQEDAVGQGDHPLEIGLIVGHEPQFGQAQPEAGLVQNTHDDGFAMGTGNDANAKVDHLAAHVGLDTAVLRNTLLGDIHCRRNLETGDHRGLQPLRDILHLGHHAVDAVAQAKTLAHGLEMNIRSPELEGVDDDLVDQSDDGCVCVEGLAIGLHIAAQRTDLDLTLGDVLNHPGDVGIAASTGTAAAVVLVESGREVCLAGHAVLEGLTQGDLKSVDGFDV